LGLEVILAICIALVVGLLLTILAAVLSVAGARHRYTRALAAERERRAGDGR